MKKQKTIISHLKCTKCHNEISIPRKRGKLRQNGHIKHMYCPFCQEETPFEESRNYNY